MLLTQEKFNQGYPIQAYEAGKLKVAELWLDYSVSLAFGELAKPWPVTDIKELTLTALEPLLALQPELLLLGTGVKLIFPANNLMAEITARKIGVEIMDTAAACRTYNLLLGEQRRVIAALII